MRILVNECKVSAEGTVFPRVRLGYFTNFSTLRASHYLPSIA